MPLAATICFSLVALICFLAVFLHSVFGNPKILPPLTKSNMPLDGIWLLHFSWHTNNITALTLAALFGIAVWMPQHFIMAQLGTALLCGMAAIALWLALFRNRAIWNTPAPYLWPFVALIALLGLAFSA